MTLDLSTHFHQQPNSNHKDHHHNNKDHKTSNGLPHNHKDQLQVGFDPWPVPPPPLAVAYDIALYLGPQLAPLRLRPQPQQQRPQQQQGPQGRSIDADIVEAGPQGNYIHRIAGKYWAGDDLYINRCDVESEGPPQGAPQPRPPQGARLDIPQMPVELQARLLELLSAKGGTVTEVLGQDGQPADSASVLQVADALQDVNLQGGERITTRRIVVTRPIETEQEVDIQEPATKIHQKVVETPALFKTAIQGVQRVPVSLPGVKNVQTPVLQTTYAHAAPAYAGYAHAAPAGLAYA